MAYGTDDFTNVTGAITVTISGKANYTGTVTRTYQITPAPYSISTDSASKVYDGRVLTADGRIDGLVNGETVDFKVTGAQRKVGSSKNIYSLEWTGTAKESNYALASATVGDLVVSESTEKVVVNVSGGTFTYDGQAHGATVTVSPLPEGYIVAEAASTASATDVTSGVTATADKLVIRNAEGEDVTNQLDVTVNPGTIVVTPAAVKVTTPSAAKAYDGTPLTAEGTIAGLVAGETATLRTTGSQTEAGSSANTYAIDWDGNAEQSNYAVSEDLGTLTVTAQSITPRPRPVEPRPELLRRYGGRPVRLRL